MSENSDFRKYFKLDESRIALNNGGCSPLIYKAAEAMQEAVLEQARWGYSGRELSVEKFTKARAQIAGFIGAKPEHLVMTGNCSTAISIVARGFNFKPGDEILTWEQEYPSNAYPWYAVAADTGAKVVALPSEKNFSVNPDLLLSKINARTRVVAISWVQSVAGSITPLKPVLEACNRVGAWLVCDVFQGVGALPFDLKDYPGMVAITGSQKWTCGPVGHAVLAFSDDRYRELKVAVQGAMSYGGSDQTKVGSDFVSSAARFEPGTPMYFTGIGMATAMECMREFGISKISSRIVELRDYLVRGLQTRGATVFGELDSHKTGPHVTFVPRGDVALATQKLQERKVSFVSKCGGFRLSPHAFNTINELDTALECV